MKAPITYTAQRDPDGRLFYLVGGSGVGYYSLQRLREVYPGRKLLRVKATRRNRLFG